ncbi:DUF6308 family protein [Streptomyces sp. NPDC005355]|uniref:DUF6308 family protein n=1 Tax=Streptomyces sp. NPDC005355 TaxID=3157038 RepID=UPI0033A52466
MRTPDLPPLTSRLSNFITSDQASADLRRYFGIGLQPGAMPYAGSRFEHLAGGGDRPAVATAITAEDLVAVQTLSVTVPAQATLDLLEGGLGAQLSKLLSSIPDEKLYFFRS